MGTSWDLRENLWELRVGNLVGTSLELGGSHGNVVGTSWVPMGTCGSWELVSGLRGNFVGTCGNFGGTWRVPWDLVETSWVSWELVVTSWILRGNLKGPMGTSRKLVGNFVETSWELEVFRDNVVGAWRVPWELCGNLKRTSWELVEFCGNLEGPMGTSWELHGSHGNL